MNNFNVLCLGSQDTTPLKGKDCSHYIINGHIMLDCGPSVIANALGADDPLDIDTVIITHGHQDHCIGLTALFFYTMGVKGRDPKEMTIYGPRRIITSIVTYAMAAYCHGMPDPGILPNIVPLEDGDCVDIPDGDGKIKLSCINSYHNTPGLCYRFEKNGSSLCFSGDTFRIPTLAPFFHDCDALVHECSAGRVPPEKFDLEELSKKFCGHASAADAAIVANEAHAKRVYLVHTAHPHADRVVQFSEVSSIPVSYLEYAERFTC